MDINALRIKGSKCGFQVIYEIPGVFKSHGKTKEPFVYSVLPEKLGRNIRVSLGYGVSDKSLCATQAFRKVDELQIF